MIYTVTFNPSIDYIVTSDNFRAGALNRTSSEVMYPGGKGINVSLVLKNLGIDSVALGFTGGFTGGEIERLLEERDIKTSFCHVDSGNSRINVKIRGQRETELNGRGPDIGDRDIERLMDRLLLLEKGDLVVLAGSVPSGVRADIYAEICEYVGNRGVEAVVDATGDLLRETLKFHPFLIKPNIHELEELFGVTIENQEEVFEYGRKLRDEGARNVLISLGGDGAALIDSHDNMFMAKAPEGKVINTIGSGDSMVAGFLWGYIKNGTSEEALRTGIAAGSASAFSLGMCTCEEVEKLKEKIGVTGFEPTTSTSRT